LYFQCLLSNHSSTSVFFTLSLHDALPILVPFGPLPVIAHPLVLLLLRPSSHHRDPGVRLKKQKSHVTKKRLLSTFRPSKVAFLRSEEHTSELQSRFDLVCRLLLEKKKKKK